MTEEQIKTGEMKMTEGDWKESELIRINLKSPPTWALRDDHPDACKDCLHRGTIKRMDYVQPYCYFYRAVLRKDTFDGDCKYRSTKVGK